MSFGVFFRLLFSFVTGFYVSQASSKLSVAKNDLELLLLLQLFLNAGITDINHHALFMKWLRLNQVVHACWTAELYPRPNWLLKQ